MSRPLEPERLASSQDVPEAVASLLREARGDGATPEAMARLRARFVPPGSGEGNATPSASSGLGAGGVGPILIVGAVLVAGALAIGVIRSGGSRTPSSSPAPSAGVPTVSAPIPGESATALSVATDPGVPVAASEAPTAASAPASRPSGSGSIATPTETELLDGARKALGHRPEVALQFTSRHRALYPNGLLSQERDVLEVEALSRAGRGAEARSQAEQFQRNHPDSVYGRRVAGAASGSSAPRTADPRR